MCNKNELFTIGEFSIMTGISIHSLRYYDEIGALKPAYVDPVSNYRYYGFSELSKIPALMICKDAEINLGDFSDYINSDNDSINYTKLILDSHEALNKKIADCVSMQRNLDKIKFFTDVKAKLEKGLDITVSLGEQYLWLSPYSNDTLSDNDASVLRSLNISARKAHFRTSMELRGLVRIKENDDYSNYAFIRIESVDGSVPHDKRVLTIPAGKYLVSEINQCSISLALSKFDSKRSHTSPRNVFALSLAGNSLKKALHCAAISIQD